MSNYMHFNPNPECTTFKNGKNKNWSKKDGTICAICKVTGYDWLKAYQILSETGAKLHDVMTSKEVFDIVVKSLDYKNISFGKPSTGEKRFTVEEFSNLHTTGTYILNIASDVVAVIDGKHYSANNYGNSAVYSWYAKTDD